MRFFIISVTLLVWVGMGVWMYSQAASTSNITTTVSVDTYSVTVSDGSIAYGSLATSATEDTLALGDSQVVENDGNVTATINILGTTTEKWGLVPTIGTEEFRHRFSSSDGTAWEVLTASYTTLYTSFASAATDALDLEIQVPSSTTATSTQNSTVTVQATS